MDIKPVNAGYPSRESGPIGRTASAKPELQPGSSRPDAPVTETDRVELSLDVRRLISQSLIDEDREAKIASIKKAIDDGSYQTNSMRTAEKMINLERSLFS